MAKEKKSKTAETLSVRRSPILKQHGLQMAWGHAGLLGLHRHRDGGFLVLSQAGATSYQYPGMTPMERLSDCGSAVAASDRWLAFCLFGLNLWEKSDQSDLGWSWHGQLEGMFRGRARQCGLSEDGQMCWVLAEDETISFFGLPLGEQAGPVKVLRVGAEPLTAWVDWGRGHVYVSHLGGTLECWDLSSGLRLNSTKMECGLRSVVADWAVGEDGRLYRSAEGGTQSCWQVALGPTDLSCLSLTVEGMWAGTQMGEILQLSPSGQEIGRWEAHSDAVLSVICLGERTVVTCSVSEVHSWKQEDGEWQARPLQESPVEVTCRALDQQGRMLALGDGRGKIVIFDLEQHRVKANIETGQEFLTTLAFSQDSGQLAFGTGDGVVGIVSVKARQVVADYLHHDEGVVDLVFRDSLVISGSCDGQLAVWESSTGELLQQFAYGESGINRLSLALGNDVLLVEHDCGLVTTWTLPQT